MKDIGFDSQKYIRLQSERIRERRKQGFHAHSGCGRLTRNGSLLFPTGRAGTPRRR